MFLNLMRESRHIECTHASTCGVKLKKALLFLYYSIKLFFKVYYRFESLKGSSYLQSLVNKVLKLLITFINIR